MRRIERARALAPEDSKALVCYARILAGLGRMEEALVAEQQALERLPAEDRRLRAVVWTNIGNDLMRLGRYAEAEEACAEALTLAPTFADAWRNRAANAGAWAQVEAARAQVEAARAQVEAGQNYIAEALRLNPDHPTYRRLEQALLQAREVLRGQG